MSGIREFIKQYLKLYVKHEKKRMKRQTMPNMFFRQKDQMWFALMNAIDEDVDEQGNPIDENASEHALAEMKGEKHDR